VALSETRGNVLPVYVVADESASMSPVIDDLNSGLVSLHDALLREPMAAAKVRFTIVGFSSDAVVRLARSDLRGEDSLPTLASRSSTDYGSAFRLLRQLIPRDIKELKSEGYACHRPAVFFLTDGQPSDAATWHNEYALLVDREATPAAPNIIACGIGEARAATILDIATRTEFAFVSTPGVEIGLAIAEFCTALTRSIVASGRALGSDNAELVVEKPQNFRMAVDIV
jgi:uncharacterized protein YegL